MEHLSMIMKTIPISMRIVISYVMKRGILLWIWWKVNGNWDNNMIKISQWRENILEQILASEERNKSKRAGLWESQSGIRIRRLTIWVRLFEKVITDFTRSISSTRVGKPVLIMDSKVSKHKNSRWVDWGNLIYVRWNRIKNRAQRRRR